MRLSPVVVEEIRRVIAALALPPAAQEVASLLASVDLDAEQAAAMRARDEYGREGVLSWSLLVDLVGGAPIDALAEAVLGLADWGLVQVVGAHPSDVQIAGTSAIRLTHGGRLALGLAPGRGPRGELAVEPRPWLVLHGASRERLLGAARKELGPAAQVVRLPADAAAQEHAIGELAAALCRSGVVIVDATEGATEPLISGLLRRTRRARAGRVLLLADPRPARVAALECGALLRWVPDAWAAGGAGQDPGLTERLLAADPGAERPDVCGVPASALARPRKVNVPWSALELPAVAARRLELARLHVASRAEAALGGASRAGGYRLLLAGLPGTGKTMAAAALATSLERPLLKIDLSTVLSKWLGETERLLGEIFDLAEASGALLVLDEAESLFRQRDSGPGGNAGLATAVAWLLSRLDDFSGTLVATTNRVDDLDEAFYRRFDDYVVLQMPDAPTRARLWARFLADETPGLDLSELGERFVVSGGLIEGAAVRARSWSRSTGEALGPGLVLASLALELEKSGRSSREVFASRHGAAAREVLGIRDGREDP